MPTTSLATCDPPAALGIDARPASPTSPPPAGGGVDALRIEARLTDQGTLLQVRGEIDIATTPLLRAAAEAALADRSAPLHLHLGGVSFIDCAGLGALIGIRNAALLAGAPPPRITASRAVRRLITLAGVSRVLDLDPPAPGRPPAGTSAAPGAGAGAAPGATPADPVAAGAGWLTPRDPQLLPVRTGPRTVEVRRDLAGILRDGAALARRHRAVPVPREAIPGPTARQAGRGRAGPG